VTLEECDFDNAKQKWGVILWSNNNGKKQYWFYPVLNEDAVYPVNNFIEVTEVVVKDGK
ncbi:unnamed protein product, partial [Allacma fusca]